MLQECLGVNASLCVISSHSGHGFEQVTGSENLEEFIVRGLTIFLTLCFALPRNVSERCCAFHQNGRTLLLSQSKQLGFFNLYNIRVWMICDVSDIWLHHGGIKLIFPHVVCCCLMLYLMYTSKYFHLQFSCYLAVALAGLHKSPQFY